MPPADPILPVLQRRDDIVSAIAGHQVVVICGATGSGKTTQLPQIMLDAAAQGRIALAPKGIIGHTQPRRLAARSVAARIAEERGVRLGGLVGYAVRFEDQTSRETQIKVMTDGVLLAELSNDPQLSRYAAIIIDEAHERSLNIDFLIGYLRTLLPRRPELKVIITSATIDPKRFSDAFGGPSRAPVIEVSGRTYPVEMRYRSSRDDDDHEIDLESLGDAAEELFRPGVDPGDVLLFVPGEREITQAEGVLKRRGLDADILPLFSRLSSADQDRIFHPSPSGRRRIILATNVAETSLTVPGIRHVIDTGLARLSRYDPQRKVQRLPIEPISRASCEQRAGRCGRVAPGICIRLFSRESFDARPAFTDPEVRRTNLASVLLRFKSLVLGSLAEFGFLDPPDAASITDASETLFELGATESRDLAAPLTRIGRALADIPLDPRIGRMILAASDEGCLHEVITLAAALEIQDPRQRPMGRQDDADRAHAVFRHEASDLLTLLKLHDQHRFQLDEYGASAAERWCRDHFVSSARMREWGEMVRQLRRVADELRLNFNRETASPQAIHRALLTGLITNVACREGDGSFDYRSVRGGTVQIFPGSTLFKKGPKWIMAAELVQTTRLFARTVTRVEPEWIEELAGHMFQRALSDPHLDPETGTPGIWERVSMSGIVVVPRKRTALAPIDSARARAVFILDGLVRRKWKVPDASEGIGDVAAKVLDGIASTMEAARSAEAKLRTRGVIADESVLASWFDERLPRQVCGPSELRAWLNAEPTAASNLQLPLEVALTPAARVAADSSRYPDTIAIAGTGGDARVGVAYALAPGKDEDGVTMRVPLDVLPQIAERAEWLVPGMLAELVGALIKNLPKPLRARIEQAGGADAASIGASCAEVLSFAQGRLPVQLSETLGVLFGVEVESEAWSFKGLPAHLRARVCVIDEAGKIIDDDRDPAALLKRLEPKLRKHRADAARAQFGRTGIMTWDFGELPEPKQVDSDISSVPAYPALVDCGDAVMLTLVGSPREAAARSPLGVRRLLTLAVQDELVHHLRAFPKWAEMSRQFASFGTAEQLEGDVCCVVAERVFMTGQAPIRTSTEFEQRLATCRGKLPAQARETCDLISRMLEPRARVAHRLSGGTPRLWAASIAEIREHAAYLMPKGFMLSAPADKLRQYPRYVEGMRQRLFALREEGSGTEKPALEKFGPYWKRFTGWVATQMSAERARADAAIQAPAAPATKTKAPLPQARRAAPTVNLDAGEWAMLPGALSPAVEAYRWALEELRLTLFVPELSAKPAITTADLDALWKKAAAEKA
ncbi:MAG: ATP-dependent RNA helicase HrpA [Phycisphaerales bacterium]|nr:ATP-dependent RNA helicase HrpA [Phycisphaerales bacterium]